MKTLIYGGRLIDPANRVDGRLDLLIGIFVGSMVLCSGALLAGLCSGAGLGLAVLLKMNRSRRENGQIALTLYLISALCGLAVQLVF